MFNKTLKLAILCLSIFAMHNCAHSDPGFNCFRYVDDNKQFYQLDPINPPFNGNYNVTIANTHLGLPGVVNFQACHIAKDLPSNCPQGKNEIGFITTSTNECFLLAQNPDQDRTAWKFTKIPDEINSIVGIIKATSKRILQAINPISEIVKTQKVHGIEVLGNNTNAKLPYDLRMEMKCDKKADGITNLTATYSSNTYVLSFSHNKACGYDLFGFWNAIGDWKFVIGGVVALSCFVMTFWGYKLFKPSIAVIGFLVGGALTMIVLNMFYEDYDGNYKIWVLIGISALVGAAICMLLLFCIKAAFFVAGGFLGVTLGFELYNLVIFRLDGGENDVYLWVTVILLGIICALLALWFEKSIIILATAVGGSYVCVKLIGTMVGNYPDETLIAKEIAAGEWETMPTWGYIYLGITVVAAIAGIIIQCIMQKKDKENQDKEKKDEGIVYVKIDK